MRAISPCLLLLSVVAPACTSTTERANPSEKQACENSTDAAECDLFWASTEVVSAPGGPLLADVQITAGPCDAPAPCPSGCQTIAVSSGPSVGSGTTCDLVAVATDGRSEAFRVTAVDDGPPVGICCADGLRGRWVTYTPFGFPSEVIVYFSLDGGVPDGDNTSDSGAPDAD